MLTFGFIFLFGGLNRTSLQALIFLKHLIFLKLSILQLLYSSSVCFSSCPPPTKPSLFWLVSSRLRGAGTAHWDSLGIRWVRWSPIYRLFWALCDIMRGGKSDWGFETHFLKGGTSKKERRWQFLIFWGSLETYTYFCWKNTKKYI